MADMHLRVTRHALSSCLCGSLRVSLRRVQLLYHSMPTERPTTAMRWVLQR